MLAPPTRAQGRASRVRPLLVLSLTLAASGVADAGSAPIPWRTQYEAARAEAVARDRPLWLQFTGPWCLFCRRMERETFTRPEVVALSRDDFIPVKIHSDEREDLVEQFGITGLPAALILGPDGRVISRQEGYADAGEFLGFLFAARPPVRPEPEQSEIALAGYDPVSLVNGNGLTSGHESLTVRHDGLEYRFADEADREAFLRDPERFQPCNRGRCVVNLVDRGVTVVGDARYGVYYRGRLYLCADEASRQRFAADPARYADADVADAGQCPHCRTLAGRLVEGLPQFSFIHQGRRYLFSDRFHLEAFRASPEKFLR
jgi:YHS domain-containing protein/thioredoxin-related protein